MERILIRKHILAYSDGTIWQSDVDSHAIAKLDSESADIIIGLTRGKDKKYRVIYTQQQD